MKGKCDKCDREFSDQPNEYPTKIYVHKGETTCKDCLVAMGVLPDHANSEHTQLILDQAFFSRSY